VNLRRAQAEDAGKLAQVHVDAWQAAYRGVVPDSFLQGFTYQRREDAFRRALLTGLEETYLLEEIDRPVAILTIGASRDADLDASRTGEIWGIYIVPDRWRQGIGTALVRETEQMLRARGYGEIVLWVLEGNADARRFYEAMGFAVDGASKIVQLGIPLKAVRYRKMLG
jgi:ribosomal protein S18 acetylase RimI-like enzyme